MRDVVGRVSFILALALSLAASAAAAWGQSNYYVNDSSTANDQFTLQAWDGAGSGTAADPWSLGEFIAWMEGAGTQLNPGDTVWIDAGDYDHDSTTGIQITTADDGASGNPVTIRGAVQGITWLTKVHDTAGTAREQVWNITGSYVVIRDMEISNARNAGSALVGDGNAVFVNGGVGIEIINCWLHNNQYNSVSVTSSGTATISQSRISSDGSYGVWSLTGATVNVTQSSLYGHASAAIRFGSASSPVGTGTAVNNTIYQTAEAGILIANGSSGWTLRNNIIYVSGTDVMGILLFNNETGTTDYNNIFPLSGAWAGDTNGTAPGLDFPSWQATGRDANSISRDPQFVSITGGSEDFHLRSSFGRWTGAGADTIIGTADDAYAYDTADSPSIDAGNPADGFASEPEHNGNRIDQGAYGNTAQTSKSGFYDGTTVYKTWTGKTAFGGNWGTLTTDWSSANNWSDRTAPTSTDIVIIPDRGVVTNVNNEPNVNNALAAALRVRVENTTTAVTGTRDQLRYVSTAGEPLLTFDTAGGTLTLSEAAAGTALTVAAGARISTTANGTITATNDAALSNSGTVTVSGGASQTLTLMLDVTNAAAGTLSVAAATSGTLDFKRDLTNSGTLSFASGTSARFSGTVTTQSVTPGGATIGGNMTCSPSSGTTVDVVGSFTVTETLSVTSGTLRFGAASMVVSLLSPASVTGGILLMEGTSTIRFNQATPSTTTPQLTVGASGTLRTTGTTGSFPAMERDTAGDGVANDTNSVTITVAGTADLNGLTLRRLGTITGYEGLQIESGATVTNLNDIAVASSGFGINYLKTSGVFTMRGCSFDASVTFNVKILDGVAAASDLRVNMENATGAKGDSPAGEANDVDNYPSLNGGDGRVLWVYFRWKWVGGAGTNKWNDAVDVNADGVQDNWQYTGTLPPPNPFPNATSEAAASGGAYDVWIASTVNACTLNGSFGVGNLSITTSATLVGADQIAGGETLTIYGTAFKSSGGTFDADGNPLVAAADRNTVTFAGSASQTVIIIGGSGGFWNLTISKVSGSTADLGTTLTVDNNISVSGGTFDLKDYTLTVKGDITVSATTTLKVAGTSRLAMTNGTVAKTATISGTMEISGSGIADLGDGDAAAGVTLSVASGGRLRIPGSGQLRLWDGGEAVTIALGGTFEASASAAVTRQPTAPGGFAFTVNGTLEVTKLAFSYAGANGFTINSGATITSFSNVNFSTNVGSGTRRHLGVALAANLIFSGHTFDFSFDNPPLTGNNVEAIAGTNGFTFTMSGWTQTGLSDPNTRDLDNDPPDATRAAITWGRTVTWVGKWRLYRTIPVGAATAGQYVFVRLNSGTTPTAASLLTGMVADVADELRVVWWDASAGVATELGRNVPDFVTTPGSELITLHFKIPAGFDSVTGDEIRLYYGASSPSAGPALTDPESPKTLFSDNFESGSLVAGGWTFPNGAGPAASTTDPNAGTWAAQVTDATAIATIRKDLTGGTVGYYRVSVEFFRKASNVADPPAPTSDTFASSYSVNGWTSNPNLQSDALAVGVTVGWNSAGSPYSPTAIENSGSFGFQFRADVDATTDVYRVDDVAVKGYKGDITLISGTVLNATVNDTTVGAGGVEGFWNEPFHWSPLGPPLAGDDVVINGGYTFIPNVNVASTILSVRLGATAASELRMSGPANDLTTTAGFVLGASGTLTWPLADGGTTEQNGTIFVGQDFDVRGGTFTNADDMLTNSVSSTDGSPTTVHVEVGRDLLVSGDTTESGAMSDRVEINVRRNVLDTSTGWTFSGILRMYGASVGNGGAVDTFTVTLHSASRVRLFDVSMDVTGEFGDKVRPASGSQIGTEQIWIRRGVLEVPTGTTVRAEDVTGMTPPSAGDEGVVRFVVADANTARKIRVTGGTLLANRVGINGGVAYNGGTFEITSGTVTVSTNGVTTSPGYFAFNNSSSTAGNEPSIVLSGGTINVAGNWVVNNTGPIATAFSASTPNTVVMNGSAAQTITHFPAGTIPTNGFWNLTIDDTLDPGTVVTTASTGFSVQAALTITDGRFDIGAAITVTIGTATTAGSVSVGASGELRMIGTSAASPNAVLTAAAAGFPYTFSVSGTIRARFYQINNLATAGVVINDGATIRDLNDGTLNKAAGVGGPCLDLSAVTEGNRNLIPRSIKGMTFSGGTGATSVQARTRTPTVFFYAFTSFGSTSPATAEGSDDDPAERILWENAIVQNLDDTGQPTYNSLQAAHDAGTTINGHRLRVLNNVPINENFGLTKNVKIERAILVAHNGDQALTGGFGILRNCAITNGGVTVSKIQNCTFYRVGTTASSLPITAPTKQNLLIESGGWADAGTAGPSTFVNVANLDFHLTAAVAGSDLSGDADPFSDDFDGTTRTAPWDLGADETSANVTVRMVKDLSGNILTTAGNVSRFHLMGLSRGASVSGESFYYMSAGRKFYVVRWASSTNEFKVVAEYTASGPIMNLTFFVDNLGFNPPDGTSSATYWRALVWLIVDTDTDGYGDALELVVDGGGDSTTLVNPTADTCVDSDTKHAAAGKRPFPPTTDTTNGKTVNGRWVFMPGGVASANKIQWAAPARVPADGDPGRSASPSCTPNSANPADPVREPTFAVADNATTAGVYRAQDLRLFYVNDATLWKMNANPYDGSTAGLGGPNGNFGKRIWSTTTRKFDWRSSMTFNTVTKKIFVAVSLDITVAQTIMTRWAMDGLTDPPALESGWTASEEATSVEENRYGANMDNPSAGTAWMTFGTSDGTAVYSYEHASAATSPRWACALRDKADAAFVSPVVSPHRFNGTDFVLVASDGLVHKIWEKGDGEIGAGSDRTGRSAGTGRRVALASSPPLTESASLAAAVDTDWPLECTGSPVNKVWVRGAKLLWGTDQGYVYVWNWNKTGNAADEPAAGEVVVPGFPYVIPGARVTWVQATGTNKFVVGTDNGQMYQFEIPP